MINFTIINFTMITLTIITFTIINSTVIAFAMITFKVRRAPFFIDLTYFTRKGAGHFGLVNSTSF